MHVTSNELLVYLICYGCNMMPADFPAQHSLWCLCYEQSGFEGFVKDKYTALPDTRERMLATEVTAFWKYVFQFLT